MSSWLDLIGIGIDVAQSYQIYQARQQLGQMQAGAEATALQKQVLEVLRNFVFETAQDVKALEQRVTGSPQPVYVVARALNWRFQDIGISPEIFPDFSDKEYVLKVQETIAGVTQETRDRLSDAQVSQADACVQAIVQMPLLEQAIEAQEAHEHLQATEAEWRAISAKRTKGMFGGLGTLAFAWVICPMMACISSSIASINRFSTGQVGGFFTQVMEGGILLTTLLVMLGGSIGGIILLAKSSTGRFGELKRARRAWREKMPAREVWEQIVAAFGEQSSDEYREMRAARQNLMRQVLARVEGFDKYLPETT